MLVNHLPEIMAQKGISIRKLSSMTGVAYTTIRAIYHSERRSVQLAIIDAICQALEIQPGDIYTVVPDGSSTQEPTKLEERGMDRPEIHQPTGSSRGSEELPDGWKNW